MTRIVIRRQFANAKQRTAGVVAIILMCSVFVSTAQAQLCGDVDGNNSVTVTDGVNVLRAAAGLSGDCPLARCDVDGSGSVTVTDGVNVLRAAAGLSASVNCGRDPIITSVIDGTGRFGVITKIPGGLVAPPGAVKTVQKVVFADSQNLVSGRTNILTVEYDIGAAQAQAAAAEGLSLIVASASEDGVPSPGVFDLPLIAVKDTLTIALNLRNDIAVNQFQLRFANGRGGNPVGQVETYNLVIIGHTPPVCGNRVIDGNETCDPPTSTCSVSSTLGVCNAKCACTVLPGPTPTPIAGARFVDNGDGTVTDHQTGLQWEKKTTVVGSGENFTDPHDVDNLYTWCLDANTDFDCDNVQSTTGPKDGPLFTEFLAALNSGPCFAGHCDWRVPTVNRNGSSPELDTITDPNGPGCGSGGPCIAQIFGPTVAFPYWSATTDPTNPGFAWVVNFIDSFVFNDPKSYFYHVRAVRTGP